MTRLHNMLPQWSISPLLTICSCSRFATCRCYKEKHSERYYWMMSSRSANFPSESSFLTGLKVGGWGATTERGRYVFKLNRSSNRLALQCEKNKRKTRSEAFGTFRALMRELRFLRGRNLLSYLDKRNRNSLSIASEIFLETLPSEDFIGLSSNTFTIDRLFRRAEVGARSHQIRICNTIFHHLKARKTHERYSEISVAINLNLISDDCCFPSLGRPPIFPPRGTLPICFDNWWI